MQLVQAARENIGLLLEQCNVPYEIVPFDKDLYQESVDDAIRRGYPMDRQPSLRTYLRQGVVYAATAGGHLHHRPTQIWIALYASCTIFVDDVIDRFPDQMTDLLRFNNRFIRGELHGNDILDAFADIIRRASDLYRPVAAHLITTSTLNFVTANLLEDETKSMKISSAAQGYPTYQRILSGFAEACGFLVFPREIALSDYIQAIPEIRLWINNVKQVPCLVSLFDIFTTDFSDILSFYKEELVGETTNQISTQAARTNKSKLETYSDMTIATIDLYQKIVKILEGSSEAREAFERFTVGYIHFHTSLARYRLEDLEL